MPSSGTVVTASSPDGHQVRYRSTSACSASCQATDMGRCLKGNPRPRSSASPPFVGGNCAGPEGARGARGGTALVSPTNKALVGPNLPRIGRVARVLSATTISSKTESQKETFGGHHEKENLPVAGLPSAGKRANHHGRDARFVPTRGLRGSRGRQHGFRRRHHGDEPGQAFPLVARP